MAEPASITGLLIGGGLTLTGIVVGQVFSLFSGNIQRRHESAVRNKQRLEKMTDLVSTSLAWFSKLSNCRSVEEYQATTPPPDVRQIVMLARLSFPSLVQPALDYAQACVNHYGVISQFFKPHVQASFGAQMVLAMQANPQVAKHNEEITLLRNRLDDAIAKEGKKYLHV